MEDKEEGKIVSTRLLLRLCMSTNVSYISIFCDELVGLCKVISGPHLFCLILGLVPFIL
jgi:hypothetical protein